MTKDREILRELAKEYAQVALSDRCKERVTKYREHNSLKIVRPPVLVFEEPWGEITDGRLKLQCEDPALRGIEWQMRSALYKFANHEGDYTIPPYFPVGLSLNDTGTGLNVNEEILTADTGTNITSHGYQDVLADEEAVSKIKMPVLSVDHEATQRSLARADEIFSGIMPVKKTGVQIYFASWDQIPRFHGVDNCLCDLYDRPEFAHLLIETFTRVNECLLDQYEALNILETDPYYLHCTPACTYDLPVKDMDHEKITAKDIWCRAMAQIFAVVSPEMHNEFDLQYTKRFFDRCGLSYYGCCEPLDRKVDLLRQFKNLRRISITTWADVNRASECMGGDFVLSYKPNPAFVATKNFDPAPVIEETKRVLAACKRNNTPCEFILKDISTVKNHPENLKQWVETVNKVIDQEF